MLKKILKTVSSFAFFIMFLNLQPIAYAQETKSLEETKVEESEENISQWSINKRKGEIARKIKKGPFESRRAALANWCYFDINPKKFCLAENMTFVTSEPENDFSEEFESVKIELIENHQEALKKYSIKPNKKISKKFASMTAPRRSVSSAYVESPAAPESDSQQNESEEEITDATEEPFQEVLRPEESEEAEESGFSFVPETSDSSLRYKKEYLQDYAVADEFVIPPVEPVEKKLIPNPNERDNKGRTDLMKAAASGNEWQVKNLLESGAKVDLQDDDGWTALMYAARYSDSLSTMNLLLEAKADTKTINKYGASAFLLAVCYGNNPQITERLMDYYQPSDKELLKAFIFLLSSNYSFDYVMKAKINLFLEKEIPLNTFYNGKTPLMYAAQYASSTEVIKILLEHDALKTLRSVEGKTVFDYAKENSKLARDDIYWSLNSQR
ncbi:ankyrin repeat domain-containing protein [Treponema sp. C6A8]|uniref:ankyrin repeat domain-containing protein n=1 Tax=Treponema sp. C6A8 TaxID=1410609 RepID=UPI0006881FFE|nr:ankyrin repeat domain-containing protein [Treponema sp. C6A8]